MASILEGLNLSDIRAKMIREFFLIHKNGVPIFHRAYVNTTVDPALITGFLTAIFNFSKQVSNQNINKMDMDGYVSIYDTNPNFIFILNISKDVDLLLGKIILNQIMYKFDQIWVKLDGGREDQNVLINKLQSFSFGDEVDIAVNKSILEDHLKSPDKVLSEFETYLSDLFGSMGKQIIDTSVERICRNRANCKKENLKDLVNTIGTLLSKKIGNDQANSIKKQLDSHLTLVINSGKSSLPLV